MAFDQVLIMANQVESARVGHAACSLTNFDNDLEPAIAAGSVLEVGGALYEATVNIAIAGWGGIAVSNNVYIKLTVAGAAITASFTTVAPTWSTSKQGWYSGVERYIGGLYKDAGGDYTLKYLYEFMGINTVKLFGDGTIGIWDGLGFLAKKSIEIGDWDMFGSAQKTVPIVGITPGNIRRITAMVRGDIGSGRENNRILFAPLTFDIAAGAIDDGGAILMDSAGPHILLKRIAGGIFDSASYDSTPYNRGWVTIEYEV